MKLFLTSQYALRKLLITQRWLRSEHHLVQAVLVDFAIFGTATMPQNLRSVGHNKYPTEAKSFSLVNYLRIWVLPTCPP